MKKKLIASNTFKTKDKESVYFKGFKVKYGTRFFVRNSRNKIILKMGHSETVNKDDLKRIKKAVREFMKKYTLLEMQFARDDKIQLEFLDCLY
ncbi:hypothetical protein ES703_09904 [subsurface metagenome]